MSLPNVVLTQLDGALGVIPPSIGDIPAIVAPSSDGPLNTPAAFGRGQDVQSNFAKGPLVELASYLIQKTGKPVIVVRSDTTTDGGYGTIDKTHITGLCVPSADVATKPYDEYDTKILIVTGGTVGVAGITYKWSLDGGRTYSPITALGTATSITITDGNVKFSLTTATLVAGDYWTCRTTPPLEGGADLLDALTALQRTRLAWNFCALGNPVDGTSFATFDTWFQTLWTAKKHRKGLCNVRGPNVAETETEYQTAMQTLLASLTSLYVGVGGAYCKTQSAVSSRRYRRPVSWVAAVRAALVQDPSVDLADVSLGPLPSDVQIMDENGNPDEHNEEIYNTLDDLRLMTLRTLEGYEGVYITRPRILAPTGSDFLYWQYRGVMNVAADVCTRVLTKRLRHALRVSKKTGFILADEARDIETNVNSELASALLKRPSVSDVRFVLSRTDNILSTQTLHSDCRIVPLAYPDQIGVTMGFDNPANRIVAV